LVDLPRVALVDPTPLLLCLLVAPVIA
jgi:hypothetical protein